MQLNHNDNEIIIIELFRIGTGSGRFTKSGRKMSNHCPNTDLFIPEIYYSFFGTKECFHL